jgi:hypothetical protein
MAKLRTIVTALSLFACAAGAREPKAPRMIQVAPATKTAPTVAAHATEIDPERLRMERLACTYARCTGPDDDERVEWALDVLAAPGLPKPATSAIERCIQYLESHCALKEGDVPAECRDALVFTTAKKGSLANDAACRVAAQCESGYCTRISSGGFSPGVCAPKVGMGVPCKDSFICADGLTCIATLESFKNALPPVCQPIRKRGETCSAGQCAEGLACTFASSRPNANRVCRPEVPLGSKCASPYDCKSDLHCARGKCAEPGGPNAPCEDILGCELGLECSADFRCTPMQLGDRRSPPLPREGEACAEERPCALGKCASGVCQKAKPIRQCNALGPSR